MHPAQQAVWHHLAPAHHSDVTNAMHLQADGKGDNSAFLVQSRALLTQGNSAVAPFTITPPLFTLAPNSRQILRILPQNATLSDKQETLFHLSVLAIPASPAPTEVPLQVSTAMRFGLKLFYRPASLDAPSESQGCRLRFSQSAQGVRIENPTPYYQTLGKLSVGRTPVSLIPTTSMLPPGGSQTLSTQAESAEITWQTITDHGALSERCRAELTDKTEST